MGERRIIKPDWIDLGSASLRYAIAGPEHPEGPPLVLLHEMGGSIETWEPVIETLAKRHRVVAYDWRGYGHSEKIAGKISIDDHVADLDTLMIALGIGERPVIAGVAVGAAIAATFAARNRGRAGGIILICPAMGVGAEDREARLELIEQVENSGMRSIVVPGLAGGYPQRFRDGREDLFADFRARWLANDPQSFAANYRMLLDLDMEPQLARIRCPALVVAGEYDPVRTPEHTRKIAEAIKGSSFLSVPGGHHLPHQIPETCAEFVSRFANSISRAKEN